MIKANLIFYIIIISYLFSDIILINDKETGQNEKFEDITFIGTSKMGAHFKKKGRFGRFKHYVVNCEDVISISRGNVNVDFFCDEYTHNQKAILEQAFCIYCEGNIEFDKNIPICLSCDKINAKNISKNKLKGVCCHKCGKKHDSNENNPMCTMCSILN